MATRLTLAIDKEIIEAAKKYAKKNNISLSGIVELYFKALSFGTHDFKPGAITRELSGIARPTAKKSDKQLLKEALNKRFL